jgi:hypothetical protein
MSNPFGNGQGSDGAGASPGLIKPPAGPASQPSGSPEQRVAPKSIPDGGVIVKPVPPAQRVPAPSKPFKLNGG